MNEQEPRRECLQTAHLHGEAPEVTIKRAEAYLRFVQNGKANGSAEPLADEESPEHSR